MVFDHMKHKERTVLLQPDQDVSELCFLEAERVESLGVRNEAPGYVTTVREIVAPDATTDEQLEALLEAYGRQVSYFIHRFHSRAWRPYCSGSRYRYLRDRLVEAVAKKEEEGKKPEKKNGGEEEIGRGEKTGDEAGSLLSDLRPSGAAMENGAAAGEFRRGKRLGPRTATRQGKN